MTKKDQWMLDHLSPLNRQHGIYLGADTYFCSISKHQKNAFVYTVFDKVKAWVEKNGGTMRKLDGGMFIVGDRKGFEVQIRFPSYTKRDMKNIMATLWCAKGGQ